MRESALVMPPIKLSADWSDEIAFCTFVAAAPLRRLCAVSFSERATPTASSDGLTIFDPDESRLSERPSTSCVWLRLRAELRAWRFELIALMKKGDYRETAGGSLAAGLGRMGRSLELGWRT